MNIWCVEIGEPLPLEPNARLHRYGLFSRYLAGAGHAVTWWTSTFSHAPREHVLAADSTRVIDGVTVRFLHGPGYRRSVSLARVLHHRAFANAFYTQAHAVDPPDIILCSIPTLENARQVWRYAREKGVRYFIDVLDLWPDEVVNLLPSSLRAVGRLALAGSYRRMCDICREAWGILGVSQSYLDYGLRFAGRPQGPTDLLFPLGYSTVPVQAADLAHARRFWNGLGVRPGVFTVCFVGTIGRFFDLSTVIEAGRILSREFPLRLVLCGNGSNLEFYRRQASGLPFIQFPGWIDAPRIHALMSLSQVGLAPYAASSKMSLPNKPFEYFAGGLAVVSSIQGELKQILAEHQCGLTYQADSVPELCAALRRLHDDPEETATMGRRARQLLEARYSHDKVFAAVATHLAGFAQER